MPKIVCAKQPETIFANGRFGGRNAASAAQIFGFVKVTDYRLYGLDGVNKVASGEWFDAENDQAAIEVAKGLMDGKDCELWAGKRLVARIPRRHAPGRPR